jgi:hypothetical protein
VQTALIAVLDGDEVGDLVAFVLCIVVFDIHEIWFGLFNGLLELSIVGGFFCIGLVGLVCLGLHLLLFGRLAVGEVHEEVEAKQVEKHLVDDRFDCHHFNYLIITLHFVS